LSGSLATKVIDRSLMIDQNRLVYLDMEVRSKLRTSEKMLLDVFLMDVPSHFD